MSHGQFFQLSRCSLPQAFATRSLTFTESMYCGASFARRPRDTLLTLSGRQRAGGSGPEQRHEPTLAPKRKADVPRLTLDYVRLRPHGDGRTTSSSIRRRAMGAASDSPFKLLAVAPIRRIRLGTGADRSSSALRSSYQGVGIDPQGLARPDLLKRRCPYAAGCRTTIRSGPSDACIVGPGDRVRRKSPSDQRQPRSGSRPAHQRPQSAASETLLRSWRPPANGGPFCHRRSFGQHSGCVRGTTHRIQGFQVSGAPGGDIQT